MIESPGQHGERGVDHMVLYCWCDGSLAIARELPPGAMEIARGGGASLRGVLLLARDAAQPKGIDQLPGATAGIDEASMREILRAQIHRLERLAGSSVSFNTQLDTQFLGQG